MKDIDVKAKPAWFVRPFLTPDARKAWAERNSEKLTEAHRSSHISNPLLNAWFTRVFKGHIEKFSPLEPTLELGSGGSQFKNYFPKLLTSDILKLDGVDRVVDAQKMPFKNEELGNITMINVLHHIPKPLELFKEADRTLKKGGHLVFTEPYVSWVSYPVYRYVHHEPCELHPPTLGLAIDSDALLDSNQALPTLLMGRNLSDLQKAAPHLHLKETQYHSSLSYFLTGGVNFKMPLPLWLWSFLNSADALFCRIFGRWIASFMTVVFEKQN